MNSDKKVVTYKVLDLIQLYKVDILTYLHPKSFENFKKLKFEFRELIMIF